MKLLLSLLFIILPILGIADSAYLTYEKYSGGSVVCGGGFNCNAVLLSDWASIGPLPVSILGLVYYTFLFLLGLSHYLEFDISKLLKTVTKKFKITSVSSLNFASPLELMLILTSFGLFFSIYLVLLMAFVIEAWCLYCLISALITTSLFLATSIYYLYYTSYSSLFIKSILQKIFHFKYTNVIKKIFFHFPADNVHHHISSFGARIGTIKALSHLLRASLAVSHPILERKIDGIRFPNPVGLAAGFDYNGELSGILPSVGFGFHTIGTVTLHPYEGNSPPNLGRFPKSKSLLVNKGLKSLGAKKIIKNLEKINFVIPTGISIASTNKHFSSIQEQITDICTSFLLFEKSKVSHSYYELNISCPNTFGGEPFTIPTRLEPLLSVIDTLHLTKPVYVKMPIDQSEPESMELLACIARHSISGLIIGNLTKDKENPSVHPSDKKEWEKKKGNLSGKPTWERSNSLIALARSTYKKRFTIIGTGGIFSPQDAEVKMSTGADLVQLISGMIYEGPQLIGSINSHIARKKLAD